MKTQRILNLICTLLITLPLYSYHDFLKVDFNAGMQLTDRYKTSSLDKYPLLKKAKSLYENNFNPHNTNSKERIPKIIHQIWLGSPFPKKCQAFKDSWLKNNPGWTYILWTEKEIQSFGLTNKRLYDVATNYGEKSDVARYEILYHIGGLYVDTDFECLKSFEALHHSCNFYAGLCDDGCEVFNSLIGSRPGHPILKNCIEGLKSEEKINDRRNHAMAIIKRTGPHYFTDCIKQHLLHNSDKTILLPASYFFPLPYYYSHLKSHEAIQKWIKNESCAIHHWHQSWFK